MCACRGEEPEEVDYKSIILHRKELKGDKPISPAIQWMLHQCCSAASRPDYDTTNNSLLFTSLPPNPKVLPFDRQNYQQWKAQYEIQKIGHPFRMRRRSMMIQPLSYYSTTYSISTVEYEVLKRLQDFCHAYFLGMDVIIGDPIDILKLKGITKRVHTETGREQILIDDLMKYLKRHKLNKVYCVVGITIVDLYPGQEWNFTLGHASLTEGVAMCSFGRHFNSRVSSSLPSLQQQLSNMWVLVKVVIHELCHVFGLSHCYYFYCCMNESSTIEQATTQPLFLCPMCLRKLHNVLKFNIEERYRALALQCLELDKVLSVTTVSNSDFTSENDLLHFKNASKWLETCLNNISRTLTNSN